jgi:hypothetical protein
MLIDTTRLDEVDFNALPGDELFRLFGRVNEVVWQARRTIENEAARACVLTTYEMEDDDDIVVHDDAVEFSYQDRASRCPSYYSLIPTATCTSTFSPGRLRRGG